MSDRETPISAPVGSGAPSLSLIIPAYNEARTICQTLSAAWDYLSAQAYPFDVLLIDDGSNDNTLALARRFAEDHPQVQIYSIPHAGKAAALRKGLAEATGDFVVFTDADLATPLTYIEEFRERAANGCDLVIGSREGPTAERIGEPAYRHVMGRVFNLLVRALLLRDIDDTQCGFKLFRRPVVDVLLRNTRLYASPGASVSGARVTAFDVELLVVARRHDFTICSVPVVWTYGTNSKVNPVRDTLNNLLDVLRVKANDLRGRYR
ncbi:MAG TPA: dolichyl-phosphate beta-glucosyltransferase [Thermomicrobiales bacterium]|nr:dolichyl-phosphate beta-glucosyltransferase [Thermomicrobiales bacterium]